jgi:hypothetical protein
MYFILVHSIYFRPYRWTKSIIGKYFILFQFILSILDHMNGPSQIISKYYILFQFILFILGHTNGPTQIISKYFVLF